MKKVSSMERGVGECVPELLPSPFQKFAYSVRTPSAVNMSWYAQHWVVYCYTRCYHLWHKDSSPRGKISSASYFLHQVSTEMLWFSKLYLSVLSPLPQERHKISLLLKNCAVPVPDIVWVVWNWVYLIFVSKFATQMFYKPLAIFIRLSWWDTGQGNTQCLCMYVSLCMVTIVLVCICLKVAFKMMTLNVFVRLHVVQSTLMLIYLLTCTNV